MDTFFIDQTILEFLDGSFASIHKNRDLVMRDMPLLESKLALVNSALAEQKAVCTQDQQSEILVDKQECDVRPTDKQHGQKKQERPRFLNACQRIKKSWPNNQGFINGRRSGGLSQGSSGQFEALEISPKGSEIR
jgi:hypothetical protein